MLGRGFLPAEDEKPGGAPVAVISDRFWVRRFGRDLGVIGRAITINKVPLTIAGIAPPEFFGDMVGASAYFWTPIGMQPRLMKDEAPMRRRRP